MLEGKLRAGHARPLWPKLAKPICTRPILARPAGRAIATELGVGRASAYRVMEHWTDFSVELGGQHPTERCVMRHLWIATATSAVLLVAGLYPTDARAQGLVQPPSSYAPPPYGFGVPPGYGPPPNYGPPPSGREPPSYAYGPPLGYGPPAEFGPRPPGYGPLPPYAYGPPSAYGRSPEYSPAPRADELPPHVYGAPPGYGSPHQYHQRPEYGPPRPYEPSPHAIPGTQPSPDARRVI